MLDARGRPLLDEEGKVRLQAEATPGGAIGGQMEAADLARNYLQQRRGGNGSKEDAPKEEAPIEYGQSIPLSTNMTGLSVQDNPNMFGENWEKYGNVSQQQQVAQPPLVPSSAASQRLAQFTAQEMGQTGQPLPPVQTEQTSLPPVGLGAFTNSEPMDVAFRMLKGAMR